MQKNEKIIFPQDFFQRLNKKHLLLDTSFFGDYSSHPNVFVDFVEKCKEQEITFVTNVPVVTEFLRGSDKPDIFNQKSALIKKIIGDYLLPVTPSILNEEVPWLVENYGQIGKSISITDFILAAQTKAHSDLYLVTKNPSDFPSSIFSVKTYFLLQLERGLQVYGIYCFEQKSGSQHAADEIVIPF